MEIDQSLYPGNAIKQGLLARELIRSTLGKGEPLYVPVTVMLEMERVLRSDH